MHGIRERFRGNEDRIDRLERYKLADSAHLKLLSDRLSEVEAIAAEALRTALERAPAARRRTRSARSPSRRR